MRSRIVVLPKDGDVLLLDEVELAEPRPHEVVVRQYATGVCHTQLGQMARARSGPLVLGHESTGEVIAIGSLVSHVKAGDHVMLTWVPRHPMTNRKPEKPAIALGSGDVATSQTVFTWSDVTIADEVYVVPLPRDLPMDVTCIVGCAVMTGAGAVVRTAGVGPGDSVAVIGVGGIGLSAIAAAAAVGADPIIAVDLDEEKLTLAVRFGATHTVNASSSDPVESIGELTKPLDERTVGGVDFAFDCVGAKVTMEQVLSAARPGITGESRGGTAVLVGLPQSTMEFDARGLLNGEKRYIGSVGGSCSPDRDFPMFLRWYRLGKLDLDALVTHRFDLSEINEATTALKQGRITGRAIIELRSD